MKRFATSKLLTFCGAILFALLIGQPAFAQGTAVSSAVNDTLDKFIVSSGKMLSDTDQHQARTSQMKQVAAKYAVTHPGEAVPFVADQSAEFVPYAPTFMDGPPTPFIKKGVPVSIDLHLLGGSHRGRLAVDCNLWLPDENGQINHVEALPLVPDFNNGFDGGTFLDAATFTVPVDAKRRGEVQVTFSLRVWNTNVVLANAFMILYLGDTRQQEVSYYYLGSAAADDSGAYVARGWFPRGFAIRAAWLIEGKLYPVPGLFYSWDSGTVRGIPLPDFTPVSGVAGPAMLLLRTATDSWGWTAAGYAGVVGDRPHN